LSDDVNRQACQSVGTWQGTLGLGAAYSRVRKNRGSGGSAPSSTGQVLAWLQ